MRVDISMRFLDPPSPGADVISLALTSVCQQVAEAIALLHFIHTPAAAFITGIPCSAPDQHPN